MAGIYPIPTLRSSELLAQTRLVTQMHYDQRQLLRLQTQIATGRRLTVASDDAAAATRGMTIQRLLEQKAQAQVAQITATGFCGSRSFSREASSPNGMSLAPGTCPF